MFGTKHNECVGFDSRWKVTKVSAESTTQTSEFSTDDKPCNTAEKISTEIQTDGEQQSVVPGPDMEKLAQWLKKIYPQVSQEIENSSRAFNGYKLLNDDTVAKCKLLQSFDVCIDQWTGDCKVAAMSWNSTGKSLAVSCGFDHKTWCHHLGVVTVYSLSREGKTLWETPRHKLSTENCVTMLQFHPSHPAVLAASTFSGEIVVWNVQHDDDVAVVVKLLAHEEIITHLLWLHDVDAAKTVLLVTASTDGLLKLWHFSLPMNSLAVKTKYKIKAPMLGQQTRRDGDGLDSGGGAVRRTNRGILCFDFSQFIPDMFLVGIEGGVVAQCSMSGAGPLKGSSEEEPLLDPVFKYYESLEGEITGISFSPCRKDIFLTSGTDPEIRIYLIGQEEPAQVIFTNTPVNSTVWVPHEEKLIAGCGGAGMFEIYHLIKATAIRSITGGDGDDDNDKKQLANCNLMQLALNTARCSTAAVGTNKGTVQLWHVPWELLAGD